MKQNTHRSSSRGAVTTLEYAVTFTVALSLLAVIPSIFASETQSAQQDVVEAEFERIGSNVAAAIEAVDYQQQRHQSTRTASNVGGDLHASVFLDIPTRVAETRYTMYISNETLIVTNRPGQPVDVTVTYPLDTTNTVTAGGGTGGGTIRVTATDATSPIRVTSDQSTGEAPQA